MRIGLKMPAEFGLASLRAIFRSLYEALSAGHELVFLPHEYPYLPEPARARAAEALVLGCDVLAGVIDPGVLAARRRLGNDIPYLFFELGDVPMGGWNLKHHLPSLTSNDLLLVNCAAEAELAARFFHNLRVRVVPLAFDPGAFHPLDEAERREARRRLRFRDADRIVLYAGRLNLEKGVHTLLALFDVVSTRVPEARLVLAGSVESGAVLDRFRVVPVSLSGTFARLISGLEHPERVRTLDHCDPPRMRDLYNVADVKVNLTLNPDENFGLAQVEAMACGTPVVGTAWSGLKDTVVDGVTGYQVSTVVTRTGPRLDWWEAVNRIVEILEDPPGRERFRERCLREAGRYSQQAFGEALDRALSDVARGRHQPAEPVRPTEFAQAFWSACNPALPGPPHHRGARSETMYRSLVQPLTGVTPLHVAPEEALAADQVVFLSTPVQGGAEGLRPDHVFHPYPVPVPECDAQGVGAVLEVLRDQPAITVERLVGACPLPAPAVRDALAWLMEAGLVLRTRAAAGWMAPEAAGRGLGRALLSTQWVDPGATDLLVYH